MNTYKTSEIAASAGVHPNTVRLYEEWGLIPKAKRLKNGYRVFTDFHIAQLKLARLAFKVEVLQNGLRKKIINVVKTSAKGDFDNAILIAQEYEAQLKAERANAKEAAQLAGEILSGSTAVLNYSLKRKETARYLNISTDTLRSWEMNGLITIKRKENGYRVYTDEDIKRIKIIRCLRCANYSLQSILQLLCQLSQNPDANILQALNTPDKSTDIIAVCDKLISSLIQAENNAQLMIKMLYEMKNKF